jgi:predicted GIY-YIG superfamily endonuclease
MKLIGVLSARVAGMNHKQTVTIFLAEGNPTGVRSLELFNWNGKGYVIPRDRLESALERNELKTQGLYFLIGENDEGQSRLYIGESEDITSRLRIHNRNKDFWNTALVFFSKGGELNKAHVKYLEELLIKEIIEAKRVTLENGNQPQQTKLSEAEEANVLIFAENIKLILASIGYAFMKKTEEYEKGGSDIYVCDGPDANARGRYTTEGMVVLEGSLVRKEFVESVPNPHPLRAKQAELISQGVLTETSPSQLKFTRDYVFGSPSTAAAIIKARHTNGWTNWKRETDGKTMDEVIRQSPNQ